MKKLLFTISILGIIGLVAGALLFPAPQKTLAQYAGGGTGREVVCKSGYRDWSLFISSTLSYVEFVEYWKDILVRYNANLCHYQDIDTMLRRLDTVRKQIRRAFYVCGDTTRLKETYYHLEAEIFYARNFIETDKGQFIVVSETRLRKKFRDNFSKIYTSQQMDDLLEEFGEKYTSKLEAYRKCSDPSWDELVRKWQEFKETGGGIGPALQEAKEQAEERWDRMENTSMDLGRDFIGGFVDLKINGLPVEEGLDQIMNELSENTPGVGFTFDQLQASKASDMQFVEYETLKANYQLNYLTLYKETSDTFTNDVMSRLYLLDDYIKYTYPFENQTIRCVDTIQKKQCP